MLGNRKHEICIGETALATSPASPHSSGRRAPVWGCSFPPRKAAGDLCPTSVNAVMTLLMLHTPAKDNGLLPLNALSAAAVGAH